MIRTKNQYLGHSEARRGDAAEILRGRDEKEEKVGTEQDQNLKEVGERPRRLAYLPLYLSMPGARMQRQSQPTCQVGRRTGLVAESLLPA